MRTLILCFLLLPFSVFSQRQDVFVKLTDAKGTQINGDALMRGFERTMQALTISAAGKNNTQFSFTMNINGASADLKKAMANGEFLMTGTVTVMEPLTISGPRPAYTIKMERIRVVTCSEAMGCNGVMSTSVTLQASRIGWTYYQTNKTGALVVTNKYGYDAEAGTQWTNF